MSEVAARTGFSASAVRYYDQRGLVRAPARSAAGYRLYDDRSVERLEFIARAKRLGLSLEDITEVLRLRDGEECGPVQSRLAEMVAARLEDTQQGIAELRADASELAALSTQFEHAPHAGPCDERCACLVEPAADRAPRRTVPLGCTLDADAVPERVAAWAAVIRRAHHHTEIEGGVRLTFPGTPDLVAHVAALAAVEQQCCAFLTFALTLVDGRGQLDVTAPPDAAEMLTGLFAGESRAHEPDVTEGA